MVDGGKEAYYTGLDKLKKKLHDNTFLAGTSIGYVDYMVWPWFEKTGSKSSNEK